MTTKEQLHRLVDALPETELRTAERFLKYLRDVGSDPFLRKLARAPLHNEPETMEETEAVRKAKEDLAVGRVKSLEDVRREFGL